ncbi:MAG TPA: hypothetical protein VGM79_23885 [Streptosporangiaceae bacterium]
MSIAAATDQDAIDACVTEIFAGRAAAAGTATAGRTSAPPAGLGGRP